MVNAKRTVLRHRRSRRKRAKTCWMWTYIINSFEAIVKRNTKIMTKRQRSICGSLVLCQKKKETVHGAENARSESVQNSKAKI